MAKAVENKGKHPGSENLRPFPKGKSGNPGGVSKAAVELKQALADMANGASDKLWELLGSEDEKIALETARFIVEHVKGKPPQAITGEDGGPIKIGMGVVEMLRKLAAP